MGFVVSELVVGSGECKINDVDYLKDFLHRSVLDFGEKSQVNRIEEQFMEVKFVSTTLSCLFSSGHLLACCGLPSVVHWKYLHIVKNSQNIFKKRRLDEENTHKVSHFPCLKITAGFTEKMIHYQKKNNCKVSNVPRLKSQQIPHKSAICLTKKIQRKEM